MASYVYEGMLNVAGTLRVNGREVLTQAPQKYDMNGKMVTHRAIPIHTVRPGYRYCFPDGHIYIKGIDEQDPQDESFVILWSKKYIYKSDSNATIPTKCSYMHNEIRFDHSVVVYIPINFDSHAFLTDSAYVLSLCFQTPEGILQTTSPNFEIHNGKNVCVTRID